MLIRVCRAKIHRAKITKTVLHYEGSIAIAEELLEASGILPNEEVQVLNFNNGERFTTYVIKGERGTGEVCLNGPAARRAQVGDIIIIISYASMDADEAKQHQPIIIFPDEKNQVSS